jgi:pantoate--beta-alanine ligase
MNKIESVAAMQAFASQLRAAGRTVALVPTSGALHAGHAALIALAKARADAVVVSAFVNPLAFGPSEPFAKYPRCPDADRRMAEDLKVDALFTPTVEEMLPRGHSTGVQEEAVAKPLCGLSRPTHFRGVTTVMAKLLNIVRPGLLVLGQKDAQQVAVVRKMMADLHFGVEVLVGPTVREDDGLAVGVRNRELTANQRQDATGDFRRAPGGEGDGRRRRRQPRPHHRGGHPPAGRAPPGAGHRCRDRRPGHHGADARSRPRAQPAGDRRLGG